jgi:hypothetical protein
VGPGGRAARMDKEAERLIGRITKTISSLKATLSKKEIDQDGSRTALSCNPGG